MPANLIRTLPILVTLLTVSHARAFEVPGDANGDGILDLEDLPALVTCLSGNGRTDCAVFDLDGDGAVNMRDFAGLARAWGMIDCSATADASSAENAQFQAANVVDGDLQSRWSSAWADNEWLEIDYGRERHFDGLTIYWEDAYSAEYALSVSTDGTSWTQVYYTVAGDGGIDDLSFGDQTARYVKIDCLQRGTQWGHSIWEIQLHSSDRCYVPGLAGENRVDALLAEMTLGEKALLLYGQTPMELHPIPRLGIPSLRLADGPLGIRRGQATAFPAPIALASSWDVEQMEQTGVAYGREWINKGRQVLLGPCIGLVRVPHGGRNFETYGEDPFLNGRMATAMVRGVQSQGVVACVKHYACNNQEYERTTINIEVDERTLHELYLPVFRAAVQEGGAWAVMSAYNRMNGFYCTASSYLQETVLKQRWGFPGFIVSDWGAVHDTVGPANAGLDLEMDAASPVGAYWGNGQLYQAVLDGRVPEATIDDKVRRLLRAMEFTGLLDAPWPTPDEELAAHRAFCRQLAGAGIVLLKNDTAVLPIDKNAPQTVAIIGPNSQTARLGGGGSSEVSPFYSVSPRVGLEANAGPDVTFVSEIGTVLPNDAPPAIPTAWLTTPDGSDSGLRGQYYNNSGLQGAPALTRVDFTVRFDWGSGSPGPGVNADEFSVRWEGRITVSTGGAYELSTLSDDGVRLWLDNQLVIDNWTDHGAAVDAASVNLTAGRAYDLRLEYYEAGGSAIIRLSCFNAATAFNDAVTAAGDADVAVVFAGLSKALESEGYDRPSMDLDAAQVSLIQSVAAANPNTVVVIIAGSQVGMADWIDQVPAVVQAWYGGQEGGNAIADVLYGDVNPAAKLPMTFVRNWEDHPASGNYPGGQYTEGLFVGYRHFDRPGVAAPLFCFGHGLSYTTFAFSNLALDTSALDGTGEVTVSVDVTNAGTRSGAEVVQVYVRDVAAGVVRPFKELKGFAKVSLEPGASQTVTIQLGLDAFAFYDVNTNEWRIEPGTFEILVGASANDIRATATLQHPGE